MSRTFRQRPSGNAWDAQTIRGSVVTRREKSADVRRIRKTARRPVKGLCYSIPDYAAMKRDKA